MADSAWDSYSSSSSHDSSDTARATELISETKVEIYYDLNSEEGCEAGCARQNRWHSWHAKVLTLSNWEFYGVVYWTYANTYSVEFFLS